MRGWLGWLGGDLLARLGMWKGWDFGTCVVKSRMKHAYIDSLRIMILGFFCLNDGGGALGWYFIISY